MNRLEYPKEIITKQEVFEERKSFRFPYMWKFKETEDSYWLIFKDEHTQPNKIINNILR